MPALSSFRPDGLLRLLTSLALQLLLQACKHPLAIVGEGDIVDLNDTGYGCTFEQYIAGKSAYTQKLIVRTLHLKIFALPLSIRHRGEGRWKYSIYY